MANAIYRIVDGKKVLFAEENNIHSINGVKPSDDKTVIINGEDILWSKDDNLSITEKFNDIDSYIDVVEIELKEAGKVDTVNSIHPDASKNVLLTGNDINVSDDFNETIANAFRDIIRRIGIVDGDKLLRWNSDEKLSSQELTLKLVDGVLTLKNPDADICSIDLNLQYIKYSAIHEWKGTEWDPAINGLNPPSDPTVTGLYLVVGYELDDKSISYSVGSLAGLVDIYHPGKGLKIRDNDSHTFDVTIDPSSGVNLSVSEAGVKFEIKTIEFEDFLKIPSIEGNTTYDGIYFIAEHDINI